MCLMARSMPFSMQFTLPRLLRARVAALTRGQGKEKAPQASHLLCASSPWERLAHKHNKSRGKRLDQLAEEEKSGDEQLHPEERCGAHEGLRQKHSVDGHLCRVGEHSGDLGVDRASAALFRGIRTVQRHLV